MLYKFGGKQPVVGNESYVSESAMVIGDVKIGNNCYIGHGAILRGDYGRIEVGDGTAVEEGVVVHAPPDDCCSIGSKVIIGHGAIIHAKAIGTLVTVGMGAILSIRSEIGSSTIVAEGAIVKREQKIPDGVVVAGNPARKVRELSEKEKENGPDGVDLYINLARQYCQEGLEKIDLP